MMKKLQALCAALARLTMSLACVALAALGAVVLYGVVMRYVFNAAPPFVEQLALLLVICVAMFGATVGVHEAGHIGLDSLVTRLPAAGQRACAVIVDLLVLVFGAVLCSGSVVMGELVWTNRIPTLGVPESLRYLPPLLSGLLIALFAIERLAKHFWNR
jgi:TRAP-type C4-dicarboxylate transport system permease small subunit